MLHRHKRHDPEGISAELGFRRGRGKEVREQNKTGAAATDTETVDHATLSTPDMAT